MEYLDELLMFATDFPIDILVDAHCHLQKFAHQLSFDVETCSECLTPDYSGAQKYLRNLISRGLRYGIEFASVCATCPAGSEADWIDVECVYKEYPAYVIQSFGLHPWFINSFCEHIRSTTCITDEVALHAAVCSNLKDLLDRSFNSFSTAGAGECGIDPACKSLCSLDTQASLLLVHLRAAAQHHRHITIHCVSGGWGRVVSSLELLQSEGSLADIRSIIIHSCNNAPLEVVKQLLRYGNIYFSFSGRRIPFTEKEVLVAQTVPLNRILIETDAPDQLPKSLRMGPLHPLYHNEPALLRLYCHHIASVIGLPPYVFARITTENAKIALGIRAAENCPSVALMDHAVKSGTT
jgi:TatD DNase family protein